MDNKKINVEFTNFEKIYYDLLSKRVKLKFDDFHKEKEGGGKGAQIDFYPEDRSLLNSVINNNRSKEKFLIPQRFADRMVEDGIFSDGKKLYWGTSNEIDQHFDDLIIALLKDVHDSDYFKSKLIGDNYFKDGRIGNFYLHLSRYDPNQIKILRKSFNLFIQNEIEKYFIEEKDGVFEIEKKVDFVKKSNLDNYLTSKQLPDKLKTYAEEVIILFLNSFYLELLSK
ncbi:hypothetical protein [Lactococcus petauri]|jgi:hypothetical protein|uniref:hypothetical protein n=1 Tax=Lactococcus petauri TaxID=1940789 RepID=UPI0022DFFC7B|nr:hypothetical protein [Lactococcus petauri]